eukprot:evm.model.scf_468.13 EVM.evm.TU.scf_468.13   scf_468:73223-76768(+)
MSSLAASRADGFYFPPDWDPAKGPNQLNSRHPLADRARKLKSDGILIIRFEMPFNVWCLKCGDMIGKGVRFNAEKKQIGFYLGNRLWSFTMRHHCGCKLEIHTDPRNTQYALVEGLRKRVDEYSAADAQVIELSTAEEREERRTDPLKRLEHKTVAQRKAKAEHHALAALREETTMKSRHDADLNRLIRRQHREERKQEAERDRRRQELGLPDNIRLLELSPEDQEEAEKQTFGGATKAAGNWRNNRRTVLGSSIFSGCSTASKTVRAGLARGDAHSVHSRPRASGGVQKKMSQKTKALLTRRRLDAHVKLRMSDPT